MPEPLKKERPWKITPTESPAPLWTGRIVICEACDDVSQLEAGDQCEEMFLEGVQGHSFKTPPCLTCGRVNSITVPRTAAELRKLLELGFRDPDDKPHQSDDEQVANPS
jgi:hypothetical protein